MSANNQAKSAAIPSQEENNSFFSRLREPPRLRSFEEHTHAITGLPLDAVQLLMRSKLPQKEVVSQLETAGAIIKTLHDLRFWEPLVMLGLANSFKRHRQALEDDRLLLENNRPSDASPSLVEAWQQAVKALNDSLPPVSDQTRQAA
jgi:hypothetical protein